MEMSKSYFLINITAPNKSIVKTFNVLPVEQK
jgi:hypothetical protein